MRETTKGKRDVKKDRERREREVGELERRQREKRGGKERERERGRARLLTCTLPLAGAIVSSPLTSSAPVRYHSSHTHTDTLSISLTQGVMKWVWQVGVALASRQGMTAAFHRTISSD